MSCLHALMCSPLLGETAQMRSRKVISGSSNSAFCTNHIHVIIRNGLSHRGLFVILCRPLARIERGHTHTGYRENQLSSFWIASTFGGHCARAVFLLFFGLPSASLLRWFYADTEWELHPMPKHAQLIWSQLALSQPGNSSMLLGYPTSPKHKRIHI